MVIRLNEIKNLSLFLFFSIYLFSCENYRKKTFLDFEFGMSYDEYIKHAIKLQESNIINNLNRDVFDYVLEVGEKRVFFTCTAYFFSNERLTSIDVKSTYYLKEDEKTYILDMLQNKYGKPSYPFQINPYDKCYSNAHWANDDDVNLVFENCTINSGTISYSAGKELYENIKSKVKKDKGSIEVQNKY